MPRLSISRHNGYTTVSPDMRSGIGLRAAQCAADKALVAQLVVQSRRLVIILHFCCLHIAGKTPYESAPLVRTVGTHSNMHLPVRQRASPKAETTTMELFPVMVGPARSASVHRPVCGLFYLRVSLDRKPTRTSGPRRPLPRIQIDDVMYTYIDSNDPV